MNKIPTLYSNYQELMLDIDIFGKIISTPLQSIQELRDTLFEEFRSRRPFPTMEDKRYELSNQVSPDYKIIYNKELELRDNEVLVDLTSVIPDNIKLSFEDLTPLIPKVQSMFTYEQNIKDADRLSIIEKYSLDTGEEFELGVSQTEKVYNSVKLDDSLELSDEEISNLGKTVEEPEIDEGVEIDEVTEDFEEDEDYDITYDNDEEDYEEEDSDEEDYEEDFEEDFEEEDSEEDYEEEDSDEEDFDISFDSDDDSEELEKEESDEEDYEEDFEEEESDEEDFDISFDSDDNLDDVSEELEDEEDSEEEFEEDYEEDFEEEESDEEDFDISFDSDDNLDDDSEELKDEKDSSISFDNNSEDTSSSNQEKVIDTSNGGSPPQGVDANVEVITEKESNSFIDSVLDNDSNDVGTDFIDDVIKDIDIVVPKTPMQLNPAPPKVEEVDRSAEPTDLRQFLRKHPRCDYEFALKYFSKKQINDAIKMGKIIKKGNILKI